MTPEDAYCTAFREQIKRCSRRSDLEAAWRNGRGKREALGITIGTDQYARLIGFCQDRIEEMSLPTDRRTERAG